MTSLAEKLVAIHRSLDRSATPHAFGGALALAWCTQRARATIDIDVNVFVGPDQATAVVAALPTQVTAGDDDLELLERDGQARLWWDGTPIDVFLDTTDFHRRAARRAVRHPFAGDDVPFLACSDLAVFKAFFDRTKDWADLEEMAAAGTLDVDRVVGVLVDHLGADDERIARLRRLA